MRGGGGRDCYALALIVVFSRSPPKRLFDPISSRSSDDEFRVVVLEKRRTRTRAQSERGPSLSTSGLKQAKLRRFRDSFIAAAPPLVAASNAAALKSNLCLVVILFSLSVRRPADWLPSERVGIVVTRQGRRWAGWMSSFKKASSMGEYEQERRTHLTMSKGGVTRKRTYPPSIYSHLSNDECYNKKASSTREKKGV